MPSVGRLGGFWAYFGDLILSCIQKKGINSQAQIPTQKKISTTSHPTRHQNFYMNNPLIRRENHRLSTKKKKKKRGHKKLI